jgi:hypothetical protein
MDMKACQLDKSIGEKLGAAEYAENEACLVEVLAERVRSQPPLSRHGGGEARLGAKVRFQAAFWPVTNPPLQELNIPSRISVPPFATTHVRVAQRQELLHLYWRCCSSSAYGVFATIRTLPARHRYCATNSFRGSCFLADRLGRKPLTAIQPIDTCFLKS